MSPWCPDHGLSAGFFHQCMKFKEKINIGSTLLSGGLSSTGLTPRGRKSMSQKVRVAPLHLAVWLMTTESGGEGAPASLSQLGSYGLRLILAPFQPHHLLLLLASSHGHEGTREGW